MTPLAFRLAATAALAGAVGLLYAPALSGMQAMWDATPMYAFGYLVPPISAYLVWARRARLAGVPARTDVAGGGIAFAVAAALVVAGRIAGVQIAEQVSFVVAVIATVLLVWGRTVAAHIRLPLAYLLLMVPVWDGFTEPLHAPFQRLSARIGVALLQAADVPASLDGLYIYLPNVTLEVARACSGVNYLVAVLALGIPLAYLYLPTLSRRLLLVGSAVIIAAVSNGLRVALIGALAYAEVGSPLHGPMHVLHGLFVSGVGYVVLLAGLRVLTPRGPDAGDGSPAPRAAAARDAAPPVGTGPAGRPASWPVRRMGAVAAAWLLLWGGVRWLEPEAVPLARPLAQVPAVLGEWQASGSDTRTAPWWRDADDALQRVYVGPGGARVEVAIAYFAVQRQGREAASHLSAPLHRAMVAIEPLARTEAAEAMVGRVRLPSGTGHREGVFWYEVGGRIVTSQASAKLAAARAALAGGRSPAFLVVLIEVDRSSDGPAGGRPVWQLARELARTLAPMTGRPDGPGTVGVTGGYGAGGRPWRGGAAALATGLSARRQSRHDVRLGREGG